MASTVLFSVCAGGQTQVAAERVAPSHILRRRQPREPAPGSARHAGAACRGGMPFYSLSPAYTPALDRIS